MSTTLALGQKRMNSLFRRMRQELIRPAVEVCHPLSGPKDQNEFGGRRPIWNSGHGKGPMPRDVPWYFRRGRLPHRSAAFHILGGQGSSRHRAFGGTEIAERFVRSVRLK